MPDLHALEKVLGGVDAPMSEDALIRRPRFAEALRSLARSLGIRGAARTRRVSWVLDRKPSAIALSRELARVQLDEWRWSGHTEIIELLVSELVTNALRHAPGRPVLTLTRRGDRIRCEVQDDNPAFLRPQVSDVDQPTHGLLLVDLLSCSWGAARTELGKIVWCEVAARTC